MIIRELTLFGDMLYFDNQRLASVAHVPPAVLMLLQETLATFNPDPPEIDIRGLTTDAVEMAVDEDGKLMCVYHENGPPLPDGWQSEKVVKLEAVKELLESNDDIEMIE